MSFADGLLHERQAKDEKKRKKVLGLIKRIKNNYGTQKPGDIGAIEGKKYTLSQEEKDQTLLYLTAYANGDCLK